MCADSVPEADWGWGRRLTALRPAWAVAQDSDRGAAANNGPIGGWLAGELVVRADFDRLRAYDLATGAVRWTWDVPDRNVLQAVSREANDGMVLVLYYDDRRSAGEARVAAINLATGGQLWSQRHRSAYVRREGPHIMLGATHVVSVTTTHVTSTDPADGTVLWHSPLPDSPERLDAWIMCTDPVVVVSTEQGKRGERLIFVFDDSRKMTASLSLPPQYERVELPGAVVNGTLVVKVVHPADSSSADERIGGFDLSTGKFLWERRPGLSVHTLLPHRGRLLALHGYGSRVTVFDAHDGRAIARRRLRGSGRGLLCVAGDRFAVIGNDGERHSLRVFRWR